MLEASYYDTMRDFDSALPLLNRAAAIFRGPDCGEQLAHVLIQSAIAEGYLSRPSHSVRLLRQAEPLIQSRQHALSFLSTLSVNLLECGFPLEAEAALYELRKLAPADPLIQLRILWTEARINASTGSFLVAEQAFREVRAGFEDRELSYESALVGIEQGLALAMAGAPESARPVLVEVRSLLGAMGIDREALAAELLDQALAAGCEVPAVRQALRALRCLPRRVA
jgi:tetratricopeptide (TPR) repeat protein